MVQTNGKNRASDAALHSIHDHFNRCQHNKQANAHPSDHMNGYCDEHLDDPFCEVYEWEINEEEAGERIDKFISLKESSWSRSQVQLWLKEGLVTVGGETVKANYRLAEGDEVLIKIPPSKELAIEPENIPLDIYYEDEDLIVVNKPRGMVVHPAPGHEQGTLVNALLYHCQDLSGINGILRPGIVHRIDKDTSGLLVVAKNDTAHRSLAAQFKTHAVRRRYWALVHGVIQEEKGMIKAPIGRDPRDRQRMAVQPAHGKEAVTHFQVETRYAQYTSLLLRLQTGRTHQIRVHMAYIGHPLVGDPKYGLRTTLPIEGQALHAQWLGFLHPRTGKPLEFEAPLPEALLRLLDELKD